MVDREHHMTEPCQNIRPDERPGSLFKGDRYIPKREIFDALRVDIAVTLTLQLCLSGACRRSRRLLASMQLPREVGSA